MAIEAAPYGIATETPIGNTNPITGQSWGNFAPQMSQQIANNSVMNSTNPYIQAAQATSLGNVVNAQAATAANRVNQATPYANLNYQQTGTDAYGNPIWSATQTLAQPFQQTLGNIQGQLQQATANPFDVSKFQAQTGQGYTGMEGWDKATQLINQRLQPQIQQSEARLQAQLANQGIAPGTEAYNRAMTQQSQKTNDLLNQAQLAGSQVQNQLQSQSLAQQQANNAALQQNYAQNLAARNLPLQQLGAFREATQPGYVNPYSQAAVSGPEYLTAYNASRAADIAQQNAALARQSATTSGLYGLGSALLQGSGGLGGLANLGSSAIGGLSSLGSWLGNNGLNNPFVSSSDYMSNIGATSSGAFDPNYVSPWANESWF